MNHRVIPVIDERQRLPAIPHRADDNQPDGPLFDRFLRPLQDLRISVTDRCNFRCVYCMPKSAFDKDYPFLPQSSLLSFEELIRLTRVFVGRGVRKVRLTGGEPLLRRNLEHLIAGLAAIRTPDGFPLDIALTTNGSLLAKKSNLLKQAGLRRITVSLDALDDQVFRAMNDVDFPVSQVLDGLNAAHEAGLGPIKVNMVVKRGLNDHQIMPMAEYFRNTPFVLRFIEYMDVGSSNGWQMKDVVPSSEIIETIGGIFPLAPLTSHTAAETARRWRYVDNDKEIGVISSVTEAFCNDCTRLRLSTEGKLYTCLFGSQGHDLRALIRGAGSSDDNDEALDAAISHIWRHRTDRYSEQRTANTSELVDGKRKVEMSYIGG